MAEAVSFSEEGRSGSKLMRVALEVFARGAWLNPAAWLKLAELGLSSGATSYLESLLRRALLLSASFAMAASSRATVR